MRNARIAQWILSLVTSSDRASSTVGDLMEDVAPHGGLRFWASVSHTALSLLFRDLAANPVRMAGLGALGLLIDLLLIPIFCVLIFLPYLAAVLVLLRRGVLNPQHLPSWLTSTQSGGLDGYSEVVVYAVVALVQFQVGRVLARMSPGRELAPCVAITIIASAFPLFLQLVYGRLPLVHTILALTVYQIPYLIPLLAGAVVVRRRRCDSI